MITAEDVTDEQIRELHKAGQGETFNAYSTHWQIRRQARGRCAELINSRNAK